jgi:hypothetical protein
MPETGEEIMGNYNEKEIKEIQKLARASMKADILKEIEEMPIRTASGKDRIISIYRFDLLESIQQIGSKPLGEESK